MSSILGKGSFGRVILGSINGNKVAVKICPQSSCQCIGERNALHAKHPNIASIYRILEIKHLETHIINYITSLGLPLDNFKRFGAQIVVMEFAGRQTLQQLLDDSEQEINSQRRIHLVNQIANAIQFCHDSKIIHLDIKPSNVMVMSGDICKLVDFGSSKRLDIEHECNHEFTIGKRAPLGTVIYCAPEIFTNKLVTPKADIYSFGITMWQTITRIIPFAHFEPHSIIYRVINAI
jgi:proto-oncogene serine/threonine-protein kinase mos